jgi:hypothetical protein
VRRIFLLFLFLHLIFLTLANNKVQIKPEPAWVVSIHPEAGRSPDLKDVSNGFYYELMNRQVNLVNHAVYFHFIRHIVNESGVQDASEVSVNFAPQFQQIVFHKVMIVRSGKFISQLEISSIKLADEESNAAEYEYNGIKRAYLILKDVQKGDLVDVSYSIIGINPVFGGLYSGDFYFTSSSPVANYFLSFLTEPDHTLYIKSFNQASAPTEKKGGGLKIYQWKNPHLNIGDADSNIPSWYTSDPFVTVSEFANWKQVVDWGLHIFSNYQLPLPESLLRQMDSWRKTANGNPDIFSNLALRFVQDQIRYLGLEIGTNTHEPHSPVTVYNHRFGDCKDKALLLTTILNHEHLTAYVALANTDERENLSQASPSPIAFDHAIVAIKRATGFIFVDPTLSLQRGEFINSYIPAYSWALILMPGENQLTPVAAASLFKISVVEEFNIHFRDSSSLKVKSIYLGGAADEIRNSLSTASRQEISDNYLKYYAKLIDGITITAPVVSMDDSLKNEVTVFESYMIPSIWKKNESGKLQFDVYAKLIASKIPDPAAHMETNPIAIDFPYNQEYILRLNMPEDWPLDMAELHIKNDSYQFDFTPVSNGDHLSFKYYFQTFRDFIPAADIKQYKTDYEEIDKCLSLWFTRNDLAAPAPGSKNNPNPESNINWITIWLCFFFGVLFTMLFRFLNRNTKKMDQRSDAGLPLSGWVVFLGLNLVMRIIIQTYFFVNGNYFLKSDWIHLEQVGGTKLHSLILFEMFLSLFSLTGTGALIYWFLGRRDIFPRMFIYYVCFYMAATLIQLILNHYMVLPAEMMSIRRESSFHFFRIIYASVWVVYIWKSEQVKQTFVYPPN